MTISKVRGVPTALPPVRLYLDDLEEIRQILRDAYSGFIEEENRDVDPADVLDPKFVFTVNEITITDSIDDLPTLGRSSHNLEMELQPWGCASLSIGFYFNSLRLYRLSHDQQWATYGRVLEAIRARRMVVKDSLHNLPEWVFWIVYPVGTLFPFTMGMIHWKPTQLFWFALGVYVLIVAAFFFVYYRPSKVIFAYSHKRNLARNESMRRGFRDIGFVLLGSALAEVVRRIVTAVFK